MAKRQQDSEYECSLPENVLQKAKDELSEDPKTRMQAVEALRGRFLKGIQPRLEAKVLLWFLRARKFDIEESFELLKKACLATKDSILEPSRIKQAFEDGAIEVLDDTDNDGRSVVVVRPEKFDSNPDPNNTAVNIGWNLVVPVLSHIFALDEVTQVNGSRAIISIPNFVLSGDSILTPAYGETMFKRTQDIFRMMAIRTDLVHTPIDIMVGARIVLTAYTNRVNADTNADDEDYFLNHLQIYGRDLGELHKTIRRDILPTDLGGNMPPLSNQIWKDKLLSSFEEDSTFSLVEIARSGQF